MSAGAERKGRRQYRAVLVLAGICLCSGLGLSLVYSALKESIAQKEKEAFQKGLAAVLGAADECELLVADAPEDERIYVIATDTEVLYGTLGAAKGYQSVISVLVSVRVPTSEGGRAGGGRTYPRAGDNPTIHRVAVISSQETPGLGENVNLVQKDVSIWAKLAGAGTGGDKRPTFQAQFSGKTLADLGDDQSDPLGTIDAITGATITSKGVVRAVRDAVERIRDVTAGMTPQDD